MGRPPIITQGVSKWSINPDDNATADERINWQEGQPPSTVNDSARMVMARVKEQHILDQEQFKAIAGSVNGRFGNKIKDITADRYLIEKSNYPNTWVFYFYFDDKLTQDEYNEYKNGQLYLLTNLVANGLEADDEYKKMKYAYTVIDVNALTNTNYPGSLMWIELVFKVGSNTYTHVMHFNLNFFGIAKENNNITLHELKHFVNNRVLQIGKVENNFLSTSNMIPLEMDRTYSSSRPITPTGSFMSYTKCIEEWHYISPTQCIITHHILGGASGRNTMNLPLPTISIENIAVLNTNARDMTGVDIIEIENPIRTVASYKNTDMGVWGFVSTGTYTYLVNGTSDQFAKYPMILNPTPDNTYPLIV